MQFKSLVTVTTVLLITHNAFSMPVLYTYTGNDFTVFEEGMPQVTRISGFFELDEDFGPDFSGSFVPSRFEFNNGVETLSDANNLDSIDFNFTTDTFGNPIAWLIEIDIDAFNQGDLSSIRVFNDFSLARLIFDSTNYCAVDNPTGDCDQPITGAEFPSIEAFILNTPGTWTVSVIPIPAAAWLFGSALGLLGWLKRRAS